MRIPRLIEATDPLTLAVKGWCQLPIENGELELTLSVWFGRWTSDVTKWIK